VVEVDSLSLTPKALREAEIKAGLEKLTVIQKQWLRLISEGKTPVEITTLAKVGDSTEIINRLEIARKLLGADTLQEAAEIFQQHEG
jgi:hypothetical protein